MGYATEQEEFWAGAFGREYIGRNNEETIVESNVALFDRVLKSASSVKSIVELGCNVGLNIRALHRLKKDFEICGYEINAVAAEQAAQLKIAKIINETVLNDLSTEVKFDLSFTKGVLIHINPSKLRKVYENLCNLSNRYVLVCEYYNPSPVEVEYRGNKDRLFKRDFAGDLIDEYNLRLIDYGFVYRRDVRFPQDDLSWFLLEKRESRS